MCKMNVFLINMFAAVLTIICFFATSPTVKAAVDKKYHNQSEVIDDVLDYMFTCMQEMEINPDVCSELLMKKKNHNDKKYDNCKCLGPCIAKRMGTMDVDTGKWNLARFKELSALMENDMLKNEAKIMESSCYDDINTHCEAGYAIMKCILENSPMAKDMAKNYIDAKESMEDGHHDNN